MYIFAGIFGLFMCALIAASDRRLSPGKAVQAAVMSAVIPAAWISILIYGGNTGILLAMAGAFWGLNQAVKSL